MAKDGSQARQALHDQARALLATLAEMPPVQAEASALHATLTRARAYLRQGEERSMPPLRTIHQFACTGGTLISKVLAAMPNTVVLSEIDPLSMMQIHKNTVPPFRPTDLIVGLQYTPREIREETLLNAFEASLRAIHADLSRQGQYLVLRDHAHSQFCTRQDRHARPTLHKIVSEVAPVRAVVTVRHPLDSFLSMRHNGWINYAPDTLEEYCLRYLDFLQHHEGLPIIKYETFVTQTPETAAELCEILELPFEPDFEISMPLVYLSGDSGRSGSVIGLRPRRPVADCIWDEAKQSAAYKTLCETLKYDAFTDDQDIV